MKTSFVRTVASAACAASVALLLLPAPTFAQFGQSGIAGTVRDTTNAVLPGVTVEAASPVLMERVLTAVTDGQGLFRIDDLRPGEYTVTFTLAGFAPVVREGIQLPSSFTATVNVEMPVGTLQETVTVTGADPDRRHPQRHLTAGVLRARYRRPPGSEGTLCFLGVRPRGYQCGAAKCHGRQ